MEESHTSNITFRAIKDFINDLVDIFGKGGGRVTPLGYYSRLISHVEGKDSDNGVKKYIDGFKVFFAEFDSKLETIEDFVTLPRDTIIKYGDSQKVYLEIQKYIHNLRTKPDMLESMRKHLLTISATIDPTEKVLAALAKPPVVDVFCPNPNISAESNFVKGEMARVKKKFEDGTIDTSNPMSAVTGLVSSGILTDMIKKMQVGMDEGTLDLNKMLAELPSTIGDMMPKGEGGADPGFDLSQITSMTQQAMMAQQTVIDEQLRNNGLITNDTVDSTQTEDVSQIEDID